MDNNNSSISSQLLWLVTNYLQLTIPHTHIFYLSPTPASEKREDTIQRFMDQKLWSRARFGENSLSTINSERLVFMEMLKGGYQGKQFEKSTAITIVRKTEEVL